MKSARGPEKPPVGTTKGDVSDDVLEEACYYLLKLGLSNAQVASHFEMTRAKVTKLAKSYARKLKSGDVSPSEYDPVFWEGVKREAEGDFKHTFVSEKGFHHAWMSELKRLDGPSLMSIYEASRDFLGRDPNQKFLDIPVPTGFDPLALEREVRKAVEAIGKLLEEKWSAERSPDESTASKLKKDDN